MQTAQIAGERGSESSVAKWWRRLGIIAWIFAAPLVLFYGAAQPLALEARALALFMPLVLFPHALVVIRAALKRAAIKGPEAAWLAFACGSNRADAIGLIAALLTVPATTLPSGLTAGVLALPWFALAAWFCIKSVWQMTARSSSLAPGDWPYGAALIYWLVGAAWLIAAAAGLQTLGFMEPIVSLTAAHFHFAGFGATCLVAFAAAPVRQDANRFFGGVYRLARAVCVAGPALVALGITFSYALEGPAGAVYALGIAAFALVLLGPVRRSSQSFWRRAGFTVAAGAALFAMFFAFLYAARGFGYGKPPVIPTMLVVHGAVNALGFIGCGLWAAAASKTEKTAE